ncbi:hypothetical protein U9M48_044972 [Paspalum notatum var. saurae]|uniref:GATA-type domain-containing protein n=1 Tax=Paspalum notatum var. saurae TaxID=547442 RepID=A0AAQ3XH90_PASNO
MLRHCHWRDSGGSDHRSIAAAAPGATMASTTFSLFLPLHTAQWPTTATAADALDDDHSSLTGTSPSSPSSSSTGSVDCTLSLGTPSSRRAELPKRADAHQAPHPSAAVSWDVAAAAADQSYYCCSGSKPAAAAAKSAAGVARADHDQMLVDRRCANCGTSSTPLWRNGPRGPKSLCNACGIRFKKEERRAAAAAAMDQAGCGYIAQRYGPAPAPCCEGAFPCGGGDVADAAADAPPPLLAWRLNVVAPAPAPSAFAVWPPERSSLFQYN